MEGFRSHWKSGNNRIKGQLEIFWGKETLGIEKLFETRKKWGIFCHRAVGVIGTSIISLDARAWTGA